MRVLIVGAGVIGAAIAEELAVRGVHVTALDMRAPGRGASWASAGLLSPFTEADPETPLLKMGVRSLGLFDGFVARARERSGRMIEYARTGTIEIAVDDRDVDRLQSHRKWLSSERIAATWFDQAQLRDFEPTVTPEARGALHVGTHGFVGVQTLVGALVQSARFAGATFEAPVEAVEVVPKSDGVEVRAGTRSYSVDHVVIAAGCWSSRVRVKGQTALPVRPVRGQLLRLLWADGVPPARPVWTTDCYTVPWQDRTLLVGATVEDAGFDDSTTAAGVQLLTAAAIRALPGAAGARLIDARAGLRPASADGLPFIGARPEMPRVTFATGHFRNGILLAPLTASMAASSILDARPDVMEAWTSPARLKGAP